jgi:hypothetical protein
LQQRAALGRRYDGRFDRTEDFPFAARPVMIEQGSWDAGVKSYGRKSVATK